MTQLVQAEPAGPASDCWSFLHAEWLVNTGEQIKTADGKSVQVWEFRHKPDEAVLSAWAKHFRNHYCPDSDIDFLRGSRSRKNYLQEIKFPSSTSTLGPSVRAGDFGEILVADYLQWVLKFSVPRVRWSGKVVRDESSKGSDVIGFCFQNDSKASPDDTLAVFESKTGFSAGGSSRLQAAINDSAKDPIRVAESLNFIKQRLFERGDKNEARKIERFQNPVDLPYRELYGAVALCSSEHFDAKDVSAADTQKIRSSSKGAAVRPHPKPDSLFLLVIRGEDMMELANDLYRRAADEA
jgi:hypothetical protein